MRFVQDGRRVTWTEKLKLMWDGTTLTVSDLASVASASAATPPGESDWQEAGGNVQARSNHRSGATGTVRLTLSGIYFPSIK